MRYNITLPAQSYLWAYDSDAQAWYPLDEWEIHPSLNLLFELGFMPLNYWIIVSVNALSLSDQLNLWALPPLVKCTPYVNWTNEYSATRFNLLDEIFASNVSSLYHRSSVLWGVGACFSPFSNSCDFLKSLSSSNITSHLKVLIIGMYMR